MAMRIKDLAVKTGEYTDKNGKKKSRYENIGSLWEGDKGMFITLKATFNPAGLERKPGSDSIMVSAFDLRDNNSGGQQQAAQRQSRPAPAAQPVDYFGDESLPF